jgi:hypothetical protein
LRVWKPVPERKDGHMLTVEAYRKNYRKIAKIDGLLREASNQTAMRTNLIKKIDSVTTLAWKRVSIGYDKNSLLAHRQVLLEATPPQIQEDPIKTGILEILREEINGVNFDNPKEEMIINRPVMYPYGFEKINLIKIYVATGEECNLYYVWSDGLQSVERTERNDNIATDMIKEQIDKEIKKLLKRTIKILKKDIKSKRKLDDRLRKRLEPFIVADKI